MEQPTTLSDTQEQEESPAGRLIALPSSPLYPFTRFSSSSSSSSSSSLLARFGIGEQILTGSSSEGHTSITSEDEPVGTDTGTLEQVRQEDEPVSIDEPSSTSQHTSFSPSQGLAEVRDRASVRDYMLTHSLQGNKFMKQRTAFVGELTPFTTDIDPEVVFQIRRMNTRQVMAYRDANAKVRYIMQDGDDTITTEKDFPMGTVQLQVIELGLAGWNITDNGVDVPVNRENIIAYLQPDEFSALYSKVMELNPILSGETARKNS